MEHQTIRDRIRATQTFNGFIPPLKKIIMSRNVIRSIEDGYTQAKNIGFQKWERQCGFNHRNISIIKELLENDK